VCTWFKWGNPRERGYWGDPDVDGRIILRRIFGNREGEETGWSWLSIGTCEYGNELPVSIKRREFLD
jgi:hypothetical protein